MKALEILKSNGVEEISKEELTDLLYYYFKDKNNDNEINVSGMDFSKFDCDVNISSITVRGNLLQCNQTVSNNLKQSGHIVKGNLYQDFQTVEKDLHQDVQDVGGDLLQCHQNVKGIVYQDILRKKVKSEKKMTKRELVKLMIENFTNEDGDLNLTGLDFSEFDGDVYISGMEVKKNLCQDYQRVKGDLYQSFQQVEGDLSQSFQQVEGNLFQDAQTVEGNLFQREQKVKGDLHQCDHEVNGKLIGKAGERNVSERED